MASSTEENSIYVTLLSNDSVNLYKNSSSTFTNLLKQSLSMSDQWEVGLSDISFSIANKQLNMNQNILKRKKRNISNFNNQSVKTLKIDSNNEYDEIKTKFKELMETSDELKLKNINKTSKLLNTLNIVKPQPNISLKEKDTHNVNVKSSNIEQNVQITSPESSTIYEKDPILSSTNYIFEKSLNKFSDNINQLINKFESSDINENIFIYTDIIKPRHVGSKRIKCLKIFSVTTLKNYIHFNRIEYFPLEAYNINDISIMIRNDEGEEINFNKLVPVYCTLHFKKKFI